MLWTPLVPILAARYDHLAAVSYGSDHVMIAGGVGVGGARTDVLMLTPPDECKVWDVVHLPESLSDAAAYGDFVFGGKNGTGHVSPAVLQEFSVPDTHMVLDKGGRWGHRVVGHADDTAWPALVLFGKTGQGQFAGADDVLECSPGTGCKPFPTTGDAPSPRMWTAATRAGDSIYVVGGLTDDGPDNGFWRLDLASGAWEILDACAQGDTEGACAVRSGHNLIACPAAWGLDADRLIMFGGELASGDGSSGLFTWERASGWTAVSGDDDAAVWPDGRLGATLSVLSKDQAILAGGKQGWTSKTTILADTYSLALGDLCDPNPGGEKKPRPDKKEDNVTLIVMAVGITLGLSLIVGGIMLHRRLAAKREPVPEGILYGELGE